MLTHLDYTSINTNCEVEFIKNTTGGVSNNKGLEGFINIFPELGVTNGATENNKLFIYEVDNGGETHAKLLWEVYKDAIYDLPRPTND